VSYDYGKTAAQEPQRQNGGAGLGPGKRTLTELLPAIGPPVDSQAVQRKESTAEPSAGEGTTTDGAYGAVVKSVAVADSPLVSDASRPKDTEGVKLKKTDRVTPSDLGVGSAFNKGNEGTGKTWWKVSVISGPNAGKEGWVQAGNLGSILDVKNAGKLESTTKVGDGTVDVHTGQKLEREGQPDGDNNFAVTYTGKDADDARWLQFVWREVIGVDDKNASVPVKDSITTTGGTYDLTSNGTHTTPGTPAKNNFNTDSKDAPTPFYESSFESDRTADSTKIIDLPGAAIGQVKGSFRGGAKKVVSRAHFTTFLVKGRKITFKTAIGLVWDFQKKEDADSPPAGVHSVAGSGAATSLPATIAERFHEQYPAFKDIK
jgi:hypothetical protein